MRGKYLFSIAIRQKGAALRLLLCWFLNIRSAVLGIPVHHYGQRALFGIYRLFEDAASTVLPDEAGFPRFTASHCSKVSGNMPTVPFSRGQSHLPLRSPLASRETINDAIAATAATSITFDIVVIDSAFGPWYTTGNGRGFLPSLVDHLRDSISAAILASNNASPCKRFPSALSRLALALFLFLPGGFIFFPHFYYTMV